MKFEEVVHSRKSVRSFRDKKVDWRDIIDCIDSMRYAPMSGNVFSLRMFLIDEKEKIKKLAEASQQAFIGEVSHVVVVCSDTKRATLSFGEAGNIYLRQQAGAAIQNFLLALTERGLATCWIGYFHEEEIRRELKLPENFQVEALFPIGYSSEAKGEIRKPKAKVDLNGVLYFNKYDVKKMRLPKSVKV